MRTLEQISKVVEKVNARLDDNARLRSFEIHALTEGTTEDGDWLYVPVTVGRRAAPAFEYAPLLSEVEERFEEEEGVKLLLIPAEVA